MSEACHVPADGNAAAAPEKPQPVSSPRNSQLASLVTPVHDNGGICASNLGIVMSGTQCRADEISHSTYRLDTNVTLSCNGKRTSDLPVTQPPAKRVFIENSHPYTNINSTLHPYQASALNSIDSGVKLSESRGNVESEYDGSAISSVSLPPTLPYESPTTTPNVKIENNDCPERIKVMAPNPPPAYKNPHKFPTNTSLKSDHASNITSGQTTAISNTTSEEHILLQRREEYHMERKRNFLTFTKTLMKYLEVREKTMHGNAKVIIRDCADKKKHGYLDNVTLSVNMQSRLRELVGEQRWKAAEELFSQSLIQLYSKRDNLSREEAKVKAKEVARITAAPLSSSNGLPAPGNNQAKCVLQ